MSVPKKHHYLPQWYLERWATDGEVTTFRRVGPQKKLHASSKPPSATGYEPHLYTIPDRPLIDAVGIETQFLQMIDDRGAKAVALAESDIVASKKEKAHLAQFLLSMIHRTPERIDYLENKLVEVLQEFPEFEDAPPSTYREAALEVFTDLVTSQQILDRFIKMRAFIISLHDDGHDLVTSDRPLLVSNGLGHKDSFAILPIGPRKLLMLADTDGLVDYLANHPAKVLSTAMNDAIVVQATNLVIAKNQRPFRFVDNRLQIEAARKGRPLEEETGLIKWQL